MNESRLYLSGRFGLRTSGVSDRSVSFASLSDEQKHVASVSDCDTAGGGCCSRSSSMATNGGTGEASARVNVCTGGGELLRLNAVVLTTSERCFCVEAIVGRANRGGEVDEQLDEHVESDVAAVLERERVTHSC